MSRRFGRNQKRAMRLALEEFGAQIGKQLEQISSLHQQMYTNQEALRLVARVLGEDFVGLQPRKVYAASLDRPYYPFPPRSNFDEFTALAAHGELADTVAYSVLEIQPNRSKVLYYEEQMRFQFETPAGDVAYGMTRQAWERMPLDAQECMLRGEIAASMANHLIKSKGRR